MLVENEMKYKNEQSARIAAMAALKALLLDANISEIQFERSITPKLSRYDLTIYLEENHVKAQQILKNQSPRIKKPDYITYTYDF